MVQVKEQLATRKNYGTSRPLSNIKYLCIHGTGNDGDSDESNGKYFQRNIVIASANYFTDDDSITRSVPDNYIAYAVGGKKWNNSGGRLYGTVNNSNSISIELCDTVKNGIVYPSAKTVANAIELTKYLMNKYNIPAHRVIRHYDVNGKPCPSYWINDDIWNKEFHSKLINYISPTGQDINPFREPSKIITSKAVAKEKGFSVFESEGEGVKWLQWELSKVAPSYNDFLNLHGGIDGKCGNNTVELLRLFQTNYGLEPDGICGKQTRTALKAN